jgi:hypothetical protein
MATAARFRSVFCKADSVKCGGYEAARRCRSDLNFAIGKKFGEAGFEIASPRRDIRIREDVHRFAKPNECCFTAGITDEEHGLFSLITEG